MRPVSEYHALGLAQWKGMPLGHALGPIALWLPMTGQFNVAASSGLGLHVAQCMSFTWTASTLTGATALLRRNWWCWRLEVVGWGMDLRLLRQDGFCLLYQTTMHVNDVLHGRAMPTYQLPAMGGYLLVTWPLLQFLAMPSCSAHQPLCSAHRAKP